jgi:hypothetical protein
MNNSRIQVRRVRRGIRLTCIFSSLLYLIWGVWPLLEYLTFERNRRDFCQPLHTSGTAFSVACIVASALIMISLVSFTACGPGGRCFAISVIPLLFHVVFFLAALGFTIQASVYIWYREKGTTTPGQLCMLESALFYRGAEMYTQITFGMLLFEFIACVYLSQVFRVLCKRSDEAVQVVFDDGEEIEPMIDDPHQRTVLSTEHIQIVGSMAKQVQDEESIEMKGMR